MFYVLFVALNALCLYCAIKDIVKTQAQDTKEIGIRREQTQDELCGGDSSNTSTPHEVGSDAEEERVYGSMRPVALSFNLN